jgi:hypothetical protein
VKIGILGAGMIGGTLATLWTRAGHEVRVSSRRPEALTPPEGVAADTLEGAAAFGEVVLLAVPFAAPATFSEPLKAALRGKVVLDADNPIPSRDGELARAVAAGGGGSGAWTAAQLPGARVVKAFNTVYFKTMAQSSGIADPVAVPLAGDDAEALEIAAKLVRDAGLAPVIAGPLATSARFDPGTPLWNSGARETAVRAWLSQSG